MSKTDKIFYSIYTILIIIFIYIDCKFLQLSQKSDILICFSFLIIFNLYNSIKNRKK